MKIHFPFPDILILANAYSDPEILQKLAPNKTLIALDGAANDIKTFTPHYILGDFDSIHKEIQHMYEKSHTSLILAPDQNLTDLEKAILFAQNHGAKTVSICCADGGNRSDHSLGALSFLKKYHSKKCTIVLYTRTERIHFLKDEIAEFSGAAKTTCAFFGWPLATLTTKGLNWDVQDFQTELGKEVSISNYFKEHTITLQVKGDLLFMMQFF